MEFFESPNYFSTKNQSIRIRRYNREFLTLDQVIIRFTKDELNTCFYCLRPVIFKAKERKQFTLDRINNAESHHINNVLVCCLTCNKMRCDDLTSLDFKKIFS